MRGSPDVAVLAAASAADRVVISADTDFVELLHPRPQTGRRSRSFAGSSRAHEIAVLVLATRRRC